jgi:hypothetical protein
VQPIIQTTPPISASTLFNLPSASSLFSPFIKQISTSFIGIDLVTVKPLSAPTDKILFMDYKYEDDQKKLLRERKEKLDRIMENIRKQKEDL